MDLVVVLVFNHLAQVAHVEMCKVLIGLAWLRAHCLLMLVMTSGRVGSQLVALNQLIARIGHVMLLLVLVMISAAVLLMDSVVAIVMVMT